jgi:isopenicillin-N N-acyltransferase-like protein
MKKRLAKIFVYSSIVILVLVALFLYAIYVPNPKVDNELYKTVVIEQPTKGFYTYKNNWLRKSESGIFEMYVEGSPYEMGVINGKLSQELVANQEIYFVEKLNEMIPSKIYINFLKYFVAWFNKDLDDNISEEYKEEIYGISQSASDEFSYIGPAYYRMLNYHAAHDIGHFLQELHMVGCTSFASWDSEQTDSSFVVGRNFDFYVGDNFAKEKIVAFVNPDSGHKFMMVTWGGMIGSVSGMNESGLSVTINAAQGDIPFKTATPISLVAREVLQYASTIHEAFELISSRKTFVGQSFLVASASDGKAVIIEKTPKETALYESDSERIFCSNHFQSLPLKDTKNNIAHQQESSTAFRYARMKHLVDSSTYLNSEQTAKILRDTKGPNGTLIGYGNERALNQLQAHHSVIFKPFERLVWVSTSPWQEGAYVCYDLNKIFDDNFVLQSDHEIKVDSLTIAPDPFISTSDFDGYIKFRTERPSIEKLIKTGQSDDERIERFILTNPNYYLVYELAGDYYSEVKNTEKAKENYVLALKKSIPWQSDSISISKKLQKIVQK